MKKISFLFCLLGCVLLTRSAYSGEPDEQRMQSTLTHVTVFLNGAQLTHLAKATVNAGISQLVIEGLPAALERQSLQVAGKGEIIILTVKSSVNYLNAQGKSPQIVRLEDSLQLARSELAS